MKLEARLTKLKQHFLENEDLITREFSALGKNMALVYFNEFFKFADVSSSVLEPILEYDKTKPSGRFIDFLQTKVLATSNAKIINTQEEIATEILNAKIILLIENESSAISIDATNLDKRAIAEPPTDNLLRGPREGFIEDLNTNLGLVRKRLKTEKLKVENLTVGSLTQTKVCVLYLDGIADKNVVKKIIAKIKAIKIDGVIDSYYIASFLQPKPESIFNQCGFAEKPDIATAKILEGRVAILVDGSPIVITLPFILLESAQSSQDYYDNHIKVSIVRILRFFGILLAVALPGMYLAFQLFHYEALPLKFVVTIMTSAQAVPMTPTIEMLFVLLMFEILFEASVRIPKGLGSSLNIIGALILGDTAVKSNLASAPTIMVVAMSSIALYLLPDETNVMRILRFLFLAAGAVMGLVGIVLGLVFICAYLCDLDSYGATYLGPYAPYIKGDQKDGLVKSHLTKMKMRPKSIPVEKRRRQDGKK